MTPEAEAFVRVLDGIKEEERVEVTRVEVLKRGLSVQIGGGILYELLLHTGYALSEMGPAIRQRINPTPKDEETIDKLTGFHRREPIAQVLTVNNLFGHLSKNTEAGQKYLSFLLRVYYAWREECWARPN